ncbi:MAG: hypothetical protein ACTHMJ_13855 [Thermomicrobiales bacterium]
METPDLYQQTPSPAAGSDPVAVLLARQAAEVAALRARLRDVEATLDLPARPGRPAPPTLPALRRRVAALERHMGLPPGLAPLPQGRPAATSTPATAPPATARAAWRDWGQALAVAALALALLVWLAHPAHHGTRTPPAATVPPTAAATSAAAAVPAAPPRPTSGALPAPPPAPVVDCSLTTAGSCFGQWSAPSSSPTSCAAGMAQDVLAMLDTCFREAPAPPSEP